MNGLRAFELMFNADVLLPSVLALEVVRQVLSGRTGGRDMRTVLIHCAWNG